MDEKNNKNFGNHDSRVNSEVVQEDDALPLASCEQGKQIQEENNDVVIDYVDNVIEDNNKTQQEDASIDMLNHGLLEPQGGMSQF
ncbi:hypothetical protein K7X08_034145 [Anisodus acutangulus]|uniref:Uncharacterized protein n=1 Tax=Anisodus acutangulus TaxID=402998 RepID=A0A9Q1M7L7_9SOLA|nr:hypothetical protein K7X08_034145 [Anisodus acutangulus]